MTRAVAWGLGVAIAMGPAALALTLSGSSSTPPATATGVGDGELDARWRAAEWAEHMVIEWLAASSADRDRLSRIFGRDVGPGATDPVDVANPSVSSVEAAGTDRWTVTVAVDVTTSPVPATEGDDPEVRTPTEPSTVRRYFQLPVAIEPGGAIAALALPAPIPGPSAAASHGLGYRHPVPESGAIGTTVAEFLAALIAGAGGLDRVVVPGVVLQPVDPPPYTAVTITEIRASESIPEQWSDGNEAHLLVTARASSADGESIIQYPLHLVARAGRWEVSEIETDPKRSSESERPLKERDNQVSEPTP